MFIVFCKWVVEKMTPNHEKARDVYLSQSVDQADLEHRMRELMRKGWMV